MFTFVHFCFLSTSIWLLYFWLLPIATNYERQKPRFQGLKSCILICFGLIIQILVFYRRFTAYKAKLEYVCCIEMSTGKK